MTAFLPDQVAVAEEELGQHDAQAGDGDHGQGMARGSAAALGAAKAAAVEAGAGAATVLLLAGDAWAARAGGTYGALCGILLRARGQALSDQDRLSAEEVAARAEVACKAVAETGGAKAADKTTVGSLAPFVETLEAEVACGLDVSHGSPHDGCRR